MAHYRLQTKLRKGNVFTSVGQKFCPRGGGIVAGGAYVAEAYMVGGCVAGGMHGGGMPGRGGACVARGTYGSGGMRGRRDGHCSRWYASCWNTFLFTLSPTSTSRSCNGFMAYLRSQI